MNSLLQILRDELTSLSRNAAARAANVPFGRLAEPHGRDVVTMLMPSGEQRQAAANDQRRLIAWTRTVTSVLHRRGRSVEVEKIERLARDLAPLILFERQDVEDVPEGAWRRAFNHEVDNTAAALQTVLSGVAQCFEAAQQQRAKEYAPFEMHIVQTAPEQWLIQANGCAETIEVDGGAWDWDPARAVDSIIVAGRALHDAVFAGAVGEAYRDARQRANADGEGLRLELHLARAGRLSSAPWELMHDGGQFLAVTRDAAISRVVEFTDREMPRRGEPLRVLLTISAPRSRQWLDAAREQQRIEGALAPLVALGLVELEVAPDGTLNTLRRALAFAAASGRPFDAWHFIGHGEFDDEAARGTLVMTDQKREAHEVGGWELATLFRDHPRLQLAILNACESARTSARGPMFGVATALIASGVSRVIAMQFPITDDAAILFAEEFYGALADGAGVDEAVGEGRRGIFFRPCTAEWITPVVYMGSHGNAARFRRGGETHM